MFFRRAENSYFILSSPVVKGGLQSCKKRLCRESGGRKLCAGSYGLCREYVCHVVRVAGDSAGDNIDRQKRVT